MKSIKEFDPISLFLVVSFVALDCAAWWTIFAGFQEAPAKVYFLGISKTSSELLVLPGNIKILIDAGPDQKILESLSKAVSDDDASIDLAIISTPEAEHVAGYLSILDHYRIGAFIYAGRDPLTAEDDIEWQLFTAKIKTLHIPLLTLEAGDSIHYKTNAITFLSPDDEFSRSTSLEDAALVTSIKTGTMTILLASDAGVNVEKFIAAKYGAIHPDIVQGSAAFAAIAQKIATSSKPGETTEIWASSSGSSSSILHAKVL